MMSNTTKVPTPDTRTPAKTTIEIISTTHLTDSPTNTTVTTEINTTTQVTTTQFPDTTTNSTYHDKQPVDDDGNTGAIVGGCIGGIIFVAAIVLLVMYIIIRRRKRKRKSRNVQELPGVDFLDSIHQDNAIKYHRENQLQDDGNQTAKQYVNLTPEGDTDEQTDPSVGNDGYLKKNKHFLNFKKPKHKKGKKQRHNEQAMAKTVHGRSTSNDIGSNEHPIYTNEEANNSKEPIKRSDSVPINEAPPPPRIGSEYATGRIPRNSGNQDNGQGVNSVLNENYVNLSGRQKGEAVFGVSLPEKNDKSTANSSGERKKKKAKVSLTNSEKSNKGDTKSPQKEETDQTQIYVNVNGANYYNLRGNQKEEIQRQSTYEEVGQESGTHLQQDDVYENP